MCIRDSTNDPDPPPFTLVIVSEEPIVKVTSLLPSRPWVIVTSLPSRNVKLPEEKTCPVPPLNWVIVSSLAVLILIVLLALSWVTVAPPDPEIVIAPDCGVPPTCDWIVVTVSASTTVPDKVITSPDLANAKVKPLDPDGIVCGAATANLTSSDPVPDPPAVSLIIFSAAVPPSSAANAYVVLLSGVV